MSLFILHLMVEATQIHVEGGLVELVRYEGGNRIVDKSEILAEDIVPVRRLITIGPTSSYENCGVFIENLRQRFTELGVPYFSVNFELLSEREQDYFDAMFASINGEGETYIRLKLVVWDYAVMH